jgi:hypothetical protein
MSAGVMPIGTAYIKRLPAIADRMDEIEKILEEQSKVVGDDSYNQGYINACKNTLLMLRGKDA